MCDYDGALAPAHRSDLVEKSGLTAQGRTAFRMRHRGGGSVRI
jgi:hypothetical protein